LVEFGNVLVGQKSSATTVTVSNTGSAAATGVTFAGSNAARFPISGNGCGAALAAGTSCSWAVSYAPSAEAADSGNVTMTYAGGGALTVSFNGTGVTIDPPPGSGQLSFVSALTMPDTPVGATSATRTVDVRNIGTSAVNVSSVVGNGEFAVTSNTCGNVAVGATCTFGVSFGPIAAGTRSGAIAVMNDGVGGSQLLMVSGTGTTVNTTPKSNVTVTVVEYHNSDFDHYFITPVAAEIDLLDSRAPPFQAWSRTGFTFKAYAGPAAAQSSVDICRFFNSTFTPKSSHFYAPKGLGCETTVAEFQDWKLEDGKLFNAVLPNAAGVCPAGTLPVFRLYNNGSGGAPNHRFVTSLGEQQHMLNLGWVAEGAGVGVGMCAPL
jgi:hypothetical protein